MTDALRPGDRAPGDLVLYTPDGSALRTGELWADTAVVLAFQRHFGCAYCRDHLARLRQEDARISEAGARTVAVFMGPPHGVGSYCRDREIPFTCVSDSSREAYRAFGLATGGVKQIVGPKVLTGGVKLLRKGIGTGLPHPGQDFRQLGGTFVVARGGTIRLAHVNRDASDNATMDAILGALGAG